KIDLLPGLRGDAQIGAADRRRWTLKNALVVFQVAVSVLLLAGTGLFLRIANDARSLRPGFAIDGIAMIETDTRYAGYSTSQARNVYEQLREKIAAIPGVQSAALTKGQPMESASVPVMVVERGGADGDAKKPSSVWAGPGFFDVLQIPVVYGRPID